MLDQIIENARIADADNVPICQDTGTVWVLLEVGRDATKNKRDITSHNTTKSESNTTDYDATKSETNAKGQKTTKSSEENHNNDTAPSQQPLSIPTDIFDDVNDAVSRAYTQGKLRMSVLHDALLNRTNTNANTPAFTEIKIVPGDKVTLHVMLKGGGSDNASRVVMLPPSAGRAGIKQEILKCVHDKATNACPPLVIGVGIGATFDKVAGLAKHALLRPIDAEVLTRSLAGSPAESLTEPLTGSLAVPHSKEESKKDTSTTTHSAITAHAHNKSERDTPTNFDINTLEREPLASFEHELLHAVNSTGIGPAALGGATTALAVHIETAPCHIAALPLAINMGCSAMRSVSIELEP